MSNTLLDHFASQVHASTTANLTRITIKAGQSRTLPASVRGFRVLSGMAWVAFDSEDLIVRFQQTLRLRPDQFNAVIRPLGSDQVELETSA